MDEVRYNRVQIILYEFEISQQEMASILGVNKNSVSRWCRNQVQPSLYQLREIAFFFRIDIRLLIEPTGWSKETGPAPVEVFKKKRAAEKTSSAKKKKNIKKSRKK